MSRSLPVVPPRTSAHDYHDYEVSSATCSNGSDLVSQKPELYSEDMPAKISAGVELSNTGLPIILHPAGKDHAEVPQQNKGKIIDGVASASSLVLEEKMDTHVDVGSENNISHKLEPHVLSSHFIDSILSSSVIANNITDVTKPVPGRKIVESGSVKTTPENPMKLKLKGKNSDMERNLLGGSAGRNPKKSDEQSVEKAPDRKFVESDSVKTTPKKKKSTGKIFVSSKKNSNAAGGHSANGIPAGGSSAGDSSAGGPSAGGSSAGGSSAGGSSAGGPSAGGPSAGGPSVGGTSKNKTTSKNNPVRVTEQEISKFDNVLILGVRVDPNGFDRSYQKGTCKPIPICKDWWDWKNRGENQSIPICKSKVCKCLGFHPSGYYIESNYDRKKITNVDDVVLFTIPTTIEKSHYQFLNVKKFIESCVKFSNIETAIEHIKISVKNGEFIDLMGYMGYPPFLKGQSILGRLNDYDFGFKIMNTTYKDEIWFVSVEGDFPEFHKEYLKAFYQEEFLIYGENFSTFTNSLVERYDGVFRLEHLINICEISPSQFITKVCYDAWSKLNYTTQKTVIDDKKNYAKDMVNQNPSKTNIITRNLIKQGDMPIDEWENSELSLNIGYSSYSYYWNLKKTSIVFEAFIAMFTFFFQNMIIRGFLEQNDVKLWMKDNISYSSKSPFERSKNSNETIVGYNPLSQDNTYKAKDLKPNFAEQYELFLELATKFQIPLVKECNIFDDIDYDISGLESLFDIMASDLVPMWGRITSAQTLSEVRNTFNRTNNVKLEYIKYYSNEDANLILERFINSGRPCFKGNSCRMGINCSCGFHNIPVDVVNRTCSKIIGETKNRENGSVSNNHHFGRLMNSIPRTYSDSSSIDIKNKEKELKEIIKLKNQDTDLEPVILPFNKPNLIGGIRLLLNSRSDNISSIMELFKNLFQARSVGMNLFFKAVEMLRMGASYYELKIDLLFFWLKLYDSRLEPEIRELIVERYDDNMQRYFSEFSWVLDLVDRFIIIPAKYFLNIADPANWTSKSFQTVGEPDLNYSFDNEKHEYLGVWANFNSELSEDFNRDNETYVRDFNRKSKTGKSKELNVLDYRGLNVNVLTRVFLMNSPKKVSGLRNLLTENQISNMFLYALNDVLDVEPASLPIERPLEIQIFLGRFTTEVVKEIHDGTFGFEKNVLFEHNKRNNYLSRKKYINDKISQMSPKKKGITGENFPEYLAYRINYLARMSLNNSVQETSQLYKVVLSETVTRKAARHTQTEISTTTKDSRVNKSSNSGYDQAVSKFVSTQIESSIQGISRSYVPKEILRQLKNETVPIEEVISRFIDLNLVYLHHLNVVKEIQSMGREDTNVNCRHRDATQNRSEFLSNLEVLLHRLINDQKLDTSLLVFCLKERADQKINTLKNIYDFLAFIEPVIDNPSYLNISYRIWNVSPKEDFIAFEDALKANEELDFAEFIANNCKRDTWKQNPLVMSNKLFDKHQKPIGVEYLWKPEQSGPQKVNRFGKTLIKRHEQVQVKIAKKKKENSQTGESKIISLNDLMENNIEPEVKFALYFDFNAYSAEVTLRDDSFSHGKQLLDSLNEDEDKDLLFMLQLIPKLVKDDEVWKYFQRWSIKPGAENRYALLLEFLPFLDNDDVFGRTECGGNNPVFWTMFFDMVNLDDDDDDMDKSNTKEDEEVKMKLIVSIPSKFNNLVNAFKSTDSKLHSSINFKKVEQWLNHIGLDNFENRYENVQNVKITFEEWLNHPRYFDSYQVSGYQQFMTYEQYAMIEPDIVEYRKMLVDCNLRVVGDSLRSNGQIYNEETIISKSNYDNFKFLEEFLKAKKVTDFDFFKNPSYFPEYMKTIKFSDYSWRNTGGTLKSTPTWETNIEKLTIQDLVKLRTKIIDALPISSERWKVEGSLIKVKFFKVSEKIGESLKPYKGVIENVKRHSKDASKNKYEFKYFDNKAYFNENSLVFYKEFSDNVTEETLQEIPAKYIIINEGYNLKVTLPQGSALEYSPIDQTWKVTGMPVVPYDSFWTISDINNMSEEATLDKFERISNLSNSHYQGLLFDVFENRKEDFERSFPDFTTSGDIIWKTCTNSLLLPANLDYIRTQLKLMLNQKCYDFKVISSLNTYEDEIEDESEDESDDESENESEDESEDEIKVVQNKVVQNIELDGKFWDNDSDSDSDSDSDDDSDGEEVRRIHARNQGILEAYLTNLSKSQKTELDKVLNENHIVRVECKLTQKSQPEIILVKCKSLYEKFVNEKKDTESTTEVSASDVLPYNVNTEDTILYSSVGYIGTVPHFVLGPFTNEELSFKGVRSELSKRLNIDETNESESDWAFITEHDWNLNSNQSTERNIGLVCKLTTWKARQSGRLKANRNTDDNSLLISKEVVGKCMKALTTLGSIFSSYNIKVRSKMVDHMLNTEGFYLTESQKNDVITQFRDSIISN